MEKHIKVARAHRALSWLYGLMFLMFSWILLSSKGDIPVLGFVFFGIFFGGIFALHFFTARGAFAKKEWARQTSQGIALLMLLGFPVGTLIGIYLLSNSWGGWESRA